MGGLNKRLETNDPASGVEPDLCGYNEYGTGRHGGCCEPHVPRGLR